MNVRTLESPSRVYKLPFVHSVIAELHVAPDWYFVTIYRPEDQDYVTYQANAAGECCWGHYGIIERQLALVDMINRSPIPTPCCVRCSTTEQLVYDDEHGHIVCADCIEPTLPMERRS